MFSSRKQSQPETQGKIRLPRLATPPVLKDLQDMYVQAEANRNREVELTWSEANSPKVFCLTVKMSMGPVEPQWIFLEDNGGQTNLICQYVTNDVYLINDVVCMTDKSAAEAQSAQVTAAAGASTDASGQPANNQGASAPQSGQQYSAGQGQHSSFTSQSSAGGGSFGTPPASSPSTSAGGSAVGNEQTTAAAASASSSPPPPMRVFDAEQQRDPRFAQVVKEDKQGYAAEFSRVGASMTGSLNDTSTSKLILSIAQNKQSGKLEVRGEESVGEVYFMQGFPMHAATPSAYGDGAIRELASWEKGLYAFFPDDKTDMRSCQGQLEPLLREGQVMLDQKRHLKSAGLTYESYLVRKHKSLSDTELKLMLSKGAQINFDFQKKIYDYLRHKRTFTDLLRDHPMDSTTWTALLFNFISCGLIDIQEPDAVRGGALNFLGEGKDNVRTLANGFIRPETGIYSYAALLFFLEYEFYRFEAYNYPLSLIIFEIQKKRDGTMGGADLITGEAAHTAAQRMELIKRPLDTLGHFETLDFAMLLPNTTGPSAAWVANRLYESLTATPLAPKHDRNTLSFAFGIASLPADGEDLNALVTAAKYAKSQAREGSFPIVLSKPAKR